MELEIERKFLLKRLPQRDPDERIFIHQYYCLIDGIWERARSMDYEIEGKLKYVHTIKKTVSEDYTAAGANIEIEKEITKEDFENFRKECYLPENNSKYITKTRHLYIHGDRTWEVDMFHEECRLIIAEVEIPTIEYSLRVPKYISKNSIYEVTGMKEFSNRSISFKI